MGRKRQWSVHRIYNDGSMSRAIGYVDDSTKPTIASIAVHFGLFDRPPRARDISVARDTDDGTNYAIVTFSNDSGPAFVLKRERIW